MMQRGRKSAASLAVVTPLPGQRAAPPDELTKAEADIWRSVVSTKPAEWFQPDSYPLLVAYCRHTVMARLLSEQIGRLPSVEEDPTTFDVLKELLKMRDRESKAVNMFARSMRLTQQSRLKAETAATAHNRANGTTAKKPWDIG